MILRSVLSAAVCLAPGPERQSGLLLAADPGPHLAPQSVVQLVLSAASRPRRQHRTATTLDILVITDTPDITAIPAIMVIMATTDNLTRG